MAGEYHGTLSGTIRTDITDEESGGWLHSGGIGIPWNCSVSGYGRALCAEMNGHDPTFGPCDGTGISDAYYAGALSESNPYKAQWYAWGGYGDVSNESEADNVIRWDCGAQNMVTLGGGGSPEEPDPEPPGCTGCESTCYETCDERCRNGCDNSCYDECDSGCTACSGGCSGDCSASCKEDCKGFCTTGCYRSCGIGCGPCTSTCSHECGGGTGSGREGASLTSCRLTCNATCKEDCGSPGSCNTSCTSACGGCFKAGTLIETINGPVPIEDICEGDEVLTQSEEYHKVYKIFKRKSKNDLIVIRAAGAPPIYTTIEHPFWVKKYLGLGYKNKKLQQLYSEPEWVEAKDIKSRDRIAQYSPSFGIKHVDEGIAYIVGRWLGDGWRTEERSNINNEYYSRFCLCCGKHEVTDLISKLNKYNIKYTICEKPTVYEFRIPSKKNRELIEILKKCGKYSYGKFIPQEVFNWDEESVLSLLQGYIESDGYVSNIGNVTKFYISSTSKKLLYGISILLRMVYRNPTWHESNRDVISFIQGRKINIRKSYTIGSQFNQLSRNYSTFDNEKSLMWASVSSVYVPSEPYDVYNLSVETDPTYFADGVLVHNCSSLCYSCTGVCIGVCSTRCQETCTHCSIQCGWWCDISCNRECFSDCNNKCIQSCVDHCMTFLKSDTTADVSENKQQTINTTPSNPDYPDPKNRKDQRDSFRKYNY